MTTDRQPPRGLFTPTRLGPVELPNRIVSTSHQTSLVHGHVPTADLVAYHEARARGGVGAIFLEATAVHPTGLLTPHTIGGYLPGITAAYEQLVTATRPHGTRLLVQLFHGGREQLAHAPKAPAIAPSAVPSPRYRSEPRAMSRREIAAVVAGYATAARYCRDGGIDGVEVSMAHGYLPAQFFAPSSNVRDDEYNGALAARLRFAREILAAIRNAVGDELAVGVRLAADEIAPGTTGREGCAEIAAEIAATGLVDFASLALGHSSSYLGASYIAPPPPAPQNAIAEPAATIRAAVPDLPLIATTRVVDLEAAERLVTEIGVEAVGMTRALIADPELVAKARRGATAEIVPCIGCNQACIGHYHAGLPIACVVNPRTGRERTWPARDDSRAQRVLVAGGGPAGIAAAVAAAADGHRVTLAERRDALGGQLRIAGLAPAHAEMWVRYRRHVERELAARGVAVRLATEATDDDVDRYDAVIVATGATPYLPPAAGTLDPPPRQALDVLADPTLVAGDVLVADWGGGWTGLDAAERLADHGHRVRYACAADAIGPDLHVYQRTGYLTRLADKGVELLHHTELAIDPAMGSAGLRHVFNGTERPLPADVTLVVAQGRVPHDPFGDGHDDRRVVRVGDVLGPRTAEEAILEGARAARGLALAPSAAAPAGAAS